MTKSDEMTTLERVVRFITGITLLYTALTNTFGPSLTINVITGLFSLLLISTALVGDCPLYRGCLFTQCDTNVQSEVEA
jgi:hypothetical protein